MLSKLLGAVEQLGIGVNNLVGGYQQRVRKGLIKTGGKMCDFLETIELDDKKASKKQRHFIRKWRADRKKLR